MTTRPAVLLQAAAGIAALCALDATIKQAMLTTSVGYATFGRYAAGTVMALAVWRMASAPPLTRAMLPGQLTRGLLIALTAYLFFYAVHALPLAEVMVLAFTAPLMIPLFAALFLGETVRPRTFAALAIGFAGVLVTVQGAPLFSGARGMGVAAALASSVTYALSAVVLRARAGKDGAVVTTLFGAAVPLILTLPFGIGAPAPGWTLVFWLVLAGLLGNVGIQLLARAYAQAEAQALSVLEFTGLIWAAGFGWLFFGEAVRPQVWAGAALIVLACLWSARGDRRQTVVEEAIGV
jgi:S-adenosylmethionine uptake transporter